MNHRTGAWLLCAVLGLSVLGCKGDPKTPEYWDKALTHAKSKKDKERIATDLRDQGLCTPAFLPVLHKQLASSDNPPEVKATLARILADLKDPSSADPLNAALDFGSSDPQVSTMNKELTIALAKLGQPQSIPTLMRLMKVRDLYVRIEAIKALGALKAKEAVEPLIELATDDSGEPFISKTAIQALGDIGSPKAAPALVRMMFKERKGVSFYVESSFALYQLGPAASDALLPVLRGEDKPLLSWARDNNIIEAALYAKAAQVLGDLRERRATPVLLSKLGFNSEFDDVKLFVRMRMADALGRIRATEAVKPLSGMLGEEEATARAEYIRALIRIGSREAVPALEKSAQTGSWDAREMALVGLAMVGDDREVPALDKLEKEEPKLTEAECKDNPDYSGCKTPSTLSQQHLQRLGDLKKRLVAAGECKTDAGCWVRKLDDSDPGVRERAAFELGRSHQAALVSELIKRLEEKNLDARVGIIQAVSWLIDDNQDAAKTALGSLGSIEKQIAAERGKNEFVKVNEDLRRLAVKIRRTQA